MNHGFLAPQFGLGRSSTQAPDEGAYPTATSPWGPTAPESGPTVTFKRRRLVEGPDVAQEDVPTTPAKAPKVFTLQAPALPNPPRETERADHTAVDAEAPSVPKLRRRRDPSRAPTLVQHVVFQPEPPVAAVAGVERPEHHQADSTKAPRKASIKSDAAPGTATRRRDAAIALDAHFRRLGF